jgi:sporulation protein YlmC with PRC-barrel domain
MHPDSHNPSMLIPGLRFRASQLIDCKITNSREESLGEVQDIVLAKDHRSIAYVVAAFGGFLGMGEKLFAIPWRVIEVSRSTVDTEPRIHLSVDQEVMKAAPGFDKARWPDMADGAWSRTVDDFYGKHGRTTDGTWITSKAASSFAASASSGTFTDASSASGRAPDSEMFHHRRVSELIGMSVVDAHGESLAKVDDLVIDAARAQIDAAALSFGGLMGVGTHIALVPMDSLTLERSEDTFRMQCTHAELEARALPGGEWPGIDGDEWLMRIRPEVM